jgi:cell division protein FtsQ
VKKGISRAFAKRIAFALGITAAFATVAVGVAALGGPAQVASRMGLAVNELVLSAGFSVGGIEISGTHFTSNDAVRERAQVEVDWNIFAQDLSAMRARIEDLAWVESAAVSRQLPNVLSIEVIEHQPFALWQKDHKLHLISRSGQVIIEASASEFPHLPLVVGDGAPQAAEPLLAFMASAPELADRVDAAIRVGERRWDLKFDNEVVLNLPEDSPAQAWRRFAELQKNTGILEQGYTRLDLRLPDMLVVRQPGGAPTLKSKEKGQAT